LEGALRADAGVADVIKRTALRPAALTTTAPRRGFPNINADLQTSKGGRTPTAADERLSVRWWGERATGSEVQSALRLVRAGPAARSGIASRLAGPGGGPPALRQEALRLKGFDRNVVIGDLARHVLIGPGGDGVDLD